MRLLIKFSLTLILILPSLSCNFIISNPHSRENPNDTEAQISKFYAFPFGTDKVITTWQWKENDKDERIEEILILHSSNDYPEVLIPFTGESITNSSKTQFEWKDLKKNSTHYFALHMKDEDDTWYAPLFAKTSLPGEFESAVFGFTQSLQVNETGPPYIESKTTSITVDNGAGPFSVLVIGLDIPDNIYILSATIETLTITGGITTSNPLKVFPVSRFWNDNPESDAGYYQLTDNNRDDYALDDSVSAFIDSAQPTLNDVTEVIRKALLYDPKQIVFKIDGAGGSSVSVFNDTFMTIEYIAN